jgi:hypothetical protein
MQTLKANELKTGDIVQIFDDAFGTAIVKNVTDDSVFLYRPYGTNFDTIYSNGLICTMGLEEYSIFRNANEYKVWRRQNGLK